MHRLLTLHSCNRWSHSGIGTFQLLYSFALMLTCHSFSYGQHRPILLWTMDRNPRSPHYWRLLDSICLHLYTALENIKTILMRNIKIIIVLKTNRQWKLEILVQVILFRSKIRYKNSYLYIKVHVAYLHEQKHRHKKSKVNKAHFDDSKKKAKFKFQIVFRLEVNRVFVKIGETLV